jgi:tRNA A-37 threonylcarbamoyl transferase component Bud32
LATPPTPSFSNTPDGPTIPLDARETLTDSAAVPVMTSQVGVDETGANATGTQSVSPTRLYGRQLLIARVVWLAVVGLLTVTFVAGLPQTYNDMLNMQPGTSAALQNAGLPQTFPALFMTTIDSLMMFSFLAICGLLFWRRSDDWMAMYTSLMLVLTAGIYTVPIYGAPSFLVTAFLVGLGETLQALFFYAFPDGKWIPRWIKWIGPPLFVIRVLIWLMITLPRYAASDLHNVEGMGRIEQDGWDVAMIMVLIAIGLISQIYRYRNHATPSQRTQVKWLLVGFGLAAGVISVYVAVVNVFGLLSTDVNSAFFSLAGARLMRHAALLALPITLTIAILRHRVFDVDLFISRGLVYGALTLLYIVLVVGMQQVFISLFGGQQSGLAIALSTALLAALFQPLRSRLQRVVDRRFYKNAPATETKIGGSTTDTATQPEPTPRPFGQQYTGSHIGPYAVREIIGRGGMGEVYRGEHTALNRRVAIKLLSHSQTDNPEFRGRFEREARIVAALRHPNIVTVYDFGTIEGTSYMVMEYIDGQELKEYVAANGGKLSLQEMLPIIRELASALDYAHDQGLIHRDIKPSNVMLQRVTTTGDPRALQAVLMDFGIAKMLSSTTQLTLTGTVGTLDYMSPEQITGSQEIDRRTDIYALGIMTYQILTGKHPFPGENAGQVLMSHLQATIPDARTLVPELPAAAALALMRAMAKNAADRFETAGAFARALAGQAGDTENSITST